VPETAEIGWAIHPDHRGHGYTEEAARAVLGVAFDHYGLHRVVAHVDAENGPSNRICERLGMRREARHRQSQWARGEWRDMIVHALLAEEWPPEGTPCSTSSSSP
jgi:aminoglycoside 6'-N-acetyltransferase